jgi:hypothetical protein
MGRKVYIHCYVAKEVTPTVADEINGPTVAVDEDELKNNFDQVKQHLVADFLNWLKGKPLALENYVEMRESSTEYRQVEEPKTPSLLVIRQDAAARVGQNRPGLVAQYKGKRVWVEKSLKVQWRDMKGRFAKREEE